MLAIEESLKTIFQLDDFESIIIVTQIFEY